MKTWNCEICVKYIYARECCSILQKVYYARENRDYIRSAILPDQVHTKSVKEGFAFTPMVVGEFHLGKSTLLTSFFPTCIKIENLQMFVQ